MEEKREAARKLSMVRLNLWLGLVSAIGNFMGILWQTPGPSVSTATVTTAKVTAAAAAATTVTAVVIMANMAAAVMRMRDYLVGHVFLMRTEELLQSDDGRDHESNLAHE